jgi:uncharacterized cupin superfamily protein
VKTTTAQPFIVAAEAAPRARQNVYPEPFARVVEGRLKRPLGDVFGLQNFGVNLTRLEPGAATALRHHHSKQDEFVFVLEGEPTLITDAGKFVLGPGTCAGFRAGDGNAHQLVNHSAHPVVLLEVGDRSPGDVVEYPDDDLAVLPARDASGPRLRFSRKDGTPY